MISTRYALVVALLLAITLVPTIIHTYIGAVQVDDYAVSDIEIQINGMRYESTLRNALWVKQTFDASDWTELEYYSENGQKILFFAARSYDLKRLYHHPEIGILRGVDLEKSGLIKISNRPEIKAHIFKNRVGKGIAAYVLIYDKQFVHNPIFMQIKESIRMLFSPRKAMTIFLVYDETMSDVKKFDSSHAAKILNSAISDYFFNKDSQSIEEKNTDDAITKQ